jgi:carboxylesterase type B
MKRFCLVLLALAAASAEDISVKTNKGSVNGMREDLEGGKYYYAFKGIPYAKPPVGKLRFQVDSSFETLIST